METGLSKNFIINYDEPILVTGSAGFIGRYVVGQLLKKGFNKIRCLVRETSNLEGLEKIIDLEGGRSKCELIQGNLLLPDDCRNITEGIKLIYHLAAGTGSKSFSEAYLNSVVATKNLMEASLEHGALKRLVNVSSFAVYTNMKKKTGRNLDETCPVETSPETRAEAYCYGKVRQDELVIAYGREKGFPYVIVRPGSVYGPGKAFIPGRVGVDTFGFFLHLGGSTPLPLTYVENCAEAIVLAGLVPCLEGEVFNIVDDDLPSSREFLRLYKRMVRKFRSVYIPKILSYSFCFFWEKFSRWSRGQVPPVFTRREWHAYWKKTYYANGKIKKMTGWKPDIKTEDGLRTFFEYCRQSIKI
ncbi:MAG: NAD(P)-dependent oxidoreductase [Candidatus Saccharicenans sp.]|nr:NAD(P)-dependent oxidoreductase [Candidatus Saccharicenans sp.]MDI6848904.1 NAD(P)-dependent oxidoreductase [Candidatus Saccharicenans sp.]